MKITKYLRNGDTTSCGCAGKQVCKTTHGPVNKIPEHYICDVDAKNRE